MVMPPASVLETCSHMSLSVCMCTLRYYGWFEVVVVPYVKCLHSIRMSQCVHLQLENCTVSLYIKDSATMRVPFKVYMIAQTDPL